MTAAEKAVTITEFLEARIAEDEAVARNASPGPWSFSNIASVGGGTIYDPTVSIANVEWDNDYVDSRIRRTRPSWQADATGEHVARHDPDRVLAECAAKRAIITSYRSCIEADAHTNITTEFGVKLTVSGMAKGLELAVKSLAAVYADHADFRQEWAL